MTEPDAPQRPTPEEIINALYYLKPAPLPEDVKLKFICGYGETAAAALTAWSERFGHYVTGLEEALAAEESADYGTGFVYWKSELTVYEDHGSKEKTWVCRADLAVW